MSPRPPSIFSIEAVLNIFENLQRYSQMNVSPVSTTPVLSPCHRFSVIAGVVDTGDKFIAGDNDTGDNLKYRE
jgi:hypothetical protein